MQLALLKYLLLSLPLCALTLTAFAYDPKSKPMPNLCKVNSLAKEDSNDCNNAFNSYLNDVITTKKQILLDTKLGHQLSEAHNSYEDERPPLHNRNRSPLIRLKPNNFSEICKLNDNTRNDHIEKMATALGYKGAQQQEYISVINSMILRGNIC